MQASVMFIDFAVKSQMLIRVEWFLYCKYIFGVHRFTHIILKALNFGSGRRFLRAYPFVV